MQDSRCKLYEEDVDVVIKQMEQNEAAARRTNDDTEANVSNHHKNDVGFESPILQVTQFLIFEFLLGCSAVSTVVGLAHLFFGFV